MDPETDAAENLPPDGGEAEEESLETLETPGGNTKNPPASKQPTQCLHWMWTWNNYAPEDIETLETLFKHLGHKYCFQEEIGGKEGTPHLQGVVSLKKRARWSEFGLPKAIHWEKVQSLTQAYLYCSKEDTRKPGTLPYTFNFTPPKHTVKYTIEIENKYQWEIEIENILKQEPDARSIYWYWEPNGCAGKTTFQKYIFTHYPDCVVCGGKSADMKNCIIEYQKTNKKLPKIILINIPKTQELNYISYTGIEEVKDMFFYSGKYEGGQVCGPNPHVIIFANKRPEVESLALDRWIINRIDA